MRAHLIQLDIRWENRAENHTRARGLIERADPDPGDLIVLPELFDVGFTLRTDVAIDDPDHKDSTLSFLQRLSDDTRCTIHGARATPAPGGRAFNTVSVHAPDHEQPVCEYRKIHPFSFGREPESYDAGDGLSSYAWNDLRVCPAICYDLRFPELFRSGAIHGAQMFVLGANWPKPRTDHWRPLLIARAIENQSFVIGVNRAGPDPHLEYEGTSIAIDPMGRILGELGTEEDTLSVEIDPKVVHDWRERFPALRDIKIRTL